MFNKIGIVIALFLFQFSSYSQSNYSRFSKLSSPEKWWVVFHPFKANKALNISSEVLKITDSIRVVNVLDKDRNGGQLDAFKHSYWMISLAHGIGKSAAVKLGNAHEKGNYQAFKKNKLEDGYIPDKASSEMDLHNNKIGIEIALRHNNLAKTELILFVISEIKKGKMKVLKKNELGLYLNCEGELLTKDSLKGRWENDKCLVYSNKN